MPAFSTDRLSSLSDIALFTTGEELPLSEVFKRMFEVFEQKEVSLNFKKQTKEMLEFFEKAIPEYDKERVYTSDIKKIMTWYNQLVKNNLLPFDEEVAKTEDAPMEKNEEVEAPKPKKTVKKKAEKNITE
jgi:dephospho-CoA kinase